MSPVLLNPSALGGAALTYNDVLATLTPYLDLGFDELSGTTLTDAQGHINGSVTSGALLGEPALLNDGGKSIKTTGSSQIISIPFLAGPSFNSIWWNFWCKFNVTGSTFSTPLYGSGGSGGFWSVNVGGGNAHLINVAQSTGGQLISPTDCALITNGSTHMITFMFNQTTNLVKFWVDGAVKYSYNRAAGAHVFDGTNPFKLGQFNNISQYAYWWYDRFSMGRASVDLTDQNVSDLYAAGIAP